MARGWRAQAQVDRWMDSLAGRVARYLCASVSVSDDGDYAHTYHTGPHEESVGLSCVEF